MSIFFLNKHKTWQVTLLVLTMMKKTEPSRVKNKIKETKKIKKMEENKI